MNVRQPKRPLLFLVLVLALTGLACQAITGTPRPTPIPTWTSAPPTTSPLPSAAAPGQVATLPASSPEALAACPVDQQTRAMQPASLPNWRQLGISACYDLSLDLGTDGSSYTGSEKLSFTNFTGAPLKELVFRDYPNAPVIYAGKLEVTAALVDGKPAQPEVFLNDQTGLRIPLSEPLAPGASVRVEMEFQGQPPVDFNPGGGYGIFERSTFKDQPGSVVALANAYPILAQWQNGAWVAAEVIGGGDAVVSTTALYHVQVQVPAGWKVASSGSQIDTRDQAGKTSFEFAGGPIREFMLVASPGFSTRQTTSGDVTITHWGIPGTEKGWDAALKVAKNAVDLYTQKFGAYPYKELDVVSLPLRYASGVEYPGLVLIEAGQYGGKGQPGPEFATVVAHEVAHQWWYGVVGSDILQDPFQDEALATYSELVYEQQYNRVAYQAELLLYKNVVKSVESQRGKEAVDQSVAAFQGDDSAYAAIVYLKGALFFQAVRDQLGDEAFFAALHAYYARNAYTTANVQALLDSFQEACRCSLDPIYRNYGVEK